MGTARRRARQAAALLGHGIAMHPYYMVSDDLKAKRLIAVLPDYEPLELDNYVVYPTREPLPARTRGFSSFSRRPAGLGESRGRLYRSGAR